jgi:hypothetical protein
MRWEAQAQQSRGLVEQQEDINENSWAVHVATGLLKFRNGGAGLL